MVSRREFIKAVALGGLAWPLAGCVGNRVEDGAGVEVNDIQSQLNATRVHDVARPDSVEALQRLVVRARRSGRPICVAGGRHSMGGQQFGSDMTLIDTSQMARVLSLDAAASVVEAQAGIRWPELVAWLLANQSGPGALSIIQKQSGADRLSLGGALSSNIHSRALTRRPIVEDVESFVLVDARGRALTCSRRENSELFSAAIGGYGLFGLIASVRLRLQKRFKVRKEVAVMDVENLLPAVESKIRDGYLYGDFPYATDENGPDWLRQGVFSCYRPVSDDTPIPQDQTSLSNVAWNEMIYLGHTNRAEAFKRFAGFSLSTHGQVYWSDLQQMAQYTDDYHTPLDARMHAAHKATEMLSEFYVPRDRLVDFLAGVRTAVRAGGTPLIYGTIRFIEPEHETLLAWARKRYACVIVNLHVVHTPEGIDHAAGAFRGLIDAAIACEGSYYLTYHRWATRKQVEACYPRFAEFLRLKKKYDPDGVFQSTWYRHYAAMFADVV